MDGIIGVRIAPRKISTYDLTLDSLAETGWCSGYLFVEPGITIEKKYKKQFKVVKRRKRLNCFKNLYEGLKQMRKEKPKATYYGMVQDDVLFCKGVREYYESSLMSSSVLMNAGVVSMFTHRRYAKPNHFGWHLVDKGRYLEMAQTFFFSPEAVDSVLEFFPHAEESNMFKYDFTDDNRIGWWARENGFSIYYHTPSLAQHIGHASACWEKQPLAVWKRSSWDFVGEEFDLANLMHQIDRGD